MVRRTSPLISLTAVPSAAAASGVFHSITGMKSSRMKRPSFASPHRERSAYSRLDVYKRQASGVGRCSWSAVLMSAASLNMAISSGRLKNLARRVRAR